MEYPKYIGVEQGSVYQGDWFERWPNSPRATKIQDHSLLAKSHDAIHFRGIYTQKNTARPLLLGLYHASVNCISITLMQVIPKMNCIMGFVQVGNSKISKTWRKDCDFRNYFNYGYHSEPTEPFRYFGIITKFGVDFHVVKSAYGPRRPIRSALISGFCSMRRRVFLLPPGMPVHRRVTPSIKFAGTHLYTWVERGTVGVKCLSQEHNTMSPARPRSGVECTNHEATAPPSYTGLKWRRTREPLLFRLGLTN